MTFGEDLLGAGIDTNVAVAALTEIRIQLYVVRLVLGHDDSLSWLFLAR